MTGSIYWREIPDHAKVIHIGKIFQVGGKSVWWHPHEHYEAHQHLIKLVSRHSHVPRPAPFSNIPQPKPFGRK